MFEYVWTSERLLHVFLSLQIISNHELHVCWTAENWSKHQDYDLFRKELPKLRQNEAAAEVVLARPSYCIMLIHIVSYCILTSMIQLWLLMSFCPWLCPLSTRDLSEEQVASISLAFEPFEAESVLKKLAELLCRAVRPWEPLSFQTFVSIGSVLWCRFSVQRCRLEKVTHVVSWCCKLSCKEFPEGPQEKLEFLLGLEKIQAILTWIARMILKVS